MKNFSARWLLLIGVTWIAGSANAQTLSPGEPTDLVSARARYEEEILKAAKPVKVQYAAYLETLKESLDAKRDAAGAAEVQKEIASLRLLPIDALHPVRVVVWNQHNSGFNDRGTQSFNLAIVSGGKEVWRQNDIKIPWEAGEDTNVTINVPSVQADLLRVEIVGTVQGHGGLAEIEYWKEDKNVAKKGRVTVSGVWENHGQFTGDRLTDGITTSKEHATGYWLAPDNETAWAEIHLRQP